MSSANGDAWILQVKRALAYQILGECGPTAWAVFTVLLAHADADGVSFPSVSRLSEISGVAKSTVRLAIQSLTEKNFVKKESRRSKDGDAERNLYRLIGVVRLSDHLGRESDHLVRQSAWVVRKSVGGWTENRWGVVRQSATKKHPLKNLQKKKHPPKSQIPLLGKMGSICLRRLCTTRTRSNRRAPWWRPTRNP